MLGLGSNSGLPGGGQQGHPYPQGTNNSVGEGRHPRRRASYCVCLSPWAPVGAGDGVEGATGHFNCPLNKTVPLVSIECIWNFDWKRDSTRKMNIEKPETSSTPTVSPVRKLRPRKEKWFCLRLPTSVGPELLPGFAPLVCEKKSQQPGMKGGRTKRGTAMRVWASAT